MKRRLEEAAKDKDGGGQNASGHARTPPWPLQELYQEFESDKTPVFYQQKFTTTKDTIW